VTEYSVTIRKIYALEVQFQVKRALNSKQLWYAIIGACAVIGMLLTLWTSFYTMEHAQKEWVVEVEDFSEKTAQDVKFNLLTLSNELSHFLMLYNGDYPKKTAIEAASKELLSNYPTLQRIGVYAGIKGANDSVNSVLLYKSDGADLSSYAGPVVSQGMMSEKNGTLNFYKTPNTSIITFYKPVIRENEVSQVLIGQLDLKEFIRKQHVQSGVIGSTDLKTVVTSDTNDNLWTSQVLALSEIPKIFHAHGESFEFDGQRIDLNWQFKPDALSGMNFFTAGMVGLIGFIITLALCGILWGQLRMQSKVSREVVLRTKELEDLGLFSVDESGYLIMVPNPFAHTESVPRQLMAIDIPEFAYIETDYFGLGGDQSATLYTLDSNSNRYTIQDGDSIN